MADNDKPKFDIPWGTLLPLIAVLAGVIAQYKPLVSKRPTVPSEKTIPVIAAQDVDARLWQDPFSVAEKQKSLLDAQIEVGVAKKGTTESHDVCALVELLRKRATQNPERVLVLAVMVDAGPYSEQAESRLRARPAVLEALSESGFVPLDGEHIGFVTADWPPVDDPSGARQIDRGLLLPWEECIATRDLARVHPQYTRRLILLWLPAASFSPNPLSRFANIIDQLADDVRNKIDIKLIGPANSTGLQSMIRELHRQPLGADAKETLKDVSIISPLATASDDTLLFQPTPAGGGADVRPASPRKTVQMFLEEAVPGLTFFRTIATDEVILKELMAELARRRVPVVQQTTPDERPDPKLAHVVILTEWDTPYGRSLSTIFAAQASGRTINEIIRQPDKWPAWVHPYRYLRGIDGQLPGDQAKESQRDQTQKTQLGQDTVAIEATEGLNQSDYLRRLARQMKEDNARWQRGSSPGIRAIGLLGQDIYDKLMILRALRPQFPHAVFFTNNYDAHFERRDDWGDTHNLIIASPFGSTLPETYIEGMHIPPFRDTNQTSMYVGTLVATGRMTKEEADSLSWQPRIFEISRHGAYDLSPAWYLEGENLAKSNKSWFRDWLFPTWGREEQNLAKTHRSNSLDWHLASRVIWSSPTFWLLVVGALALLAIVAWISVTIASPTLKGGGTTPQRLRRVFASTTFCLVCGVPLIVFSVAMFGQYKSADIAQYELGSLTASDYLTKLGVIAHVAQEPLAFFSGISIWPSEMLRLIALMLAIHFMVKAGIDLRANERELGERFSLDPLPKKTRFCWHHLGLGLEQWRTARSDKSGTEPEFSAQEAWHAYLCRNKFWPRFIRIGVLFTLYLLFSIVILRLFPPPPPPARGDFAFQFDWWAIRLAAIGMMILSFYVVDAIQLNSNFIRMFARVVTKWGDTVVEKSWRSPPLSEEELSAYNEIFFVADRTHVVARLIWYPFIVLTLMIVARLSFFDNWSWSPGLLAIYGINVCWALGSAILLRRAAEQLRGATLSNLQLSPVRGRAIEAKRATFDELIAEIRGLKKGAFAPLTDQPFVRAVLFPGAGLGLLAVGQRLLDIF
ncbi:MAG: hypothetical protein DME71_11710 [Verrucomicrobia bacterium]|nr:MAG: hypothetical protein DME71_11710 [Verrucomicrobiota bacterium]